MIALIIALYASKIKLLADIKYYFKVISQSQIFKVISRWVPCVLLIASLSSAQTTSREIAYTVMKGNDNIGKLKTTQIVNGNKVTCILHATYNFSFVFDFQLFDFTSDVYVNKMLQTSTAKRYINEKEKVSNCTKWTGAGYEFNNSNETPAKLKSPVYHSIPSLYFEEPFNYDTVFSGFYQKNLAVKKLELNKYVLELPGGNRAYYTYKNAQLVKIEAHIGIAKLIFIPATPLASK